MKRCGALTGARTALCRFPLLVLVAARYLAGGLGELVGDIVGKLAGCDGVEHIFLVLGVEELEEEFLELGNLVERHILKQAFGAAEDYGHLLLTGIGPYWGWMSRRSFLRPLSMTRAVTGSISPPNLVNDFELAELCLVDLQRTGNLLHRFDLCVTTTRDTEIPTLIAGRIPRLKSAVSRKI